MTHFQIISSIENALSYLSFQIFLEQGLNRITANKLSNGAEDPNLQNVAATSNTTLENGFPVRIISFSFFYLPFYPALKEW